MPAECDIYYGLAAALVADGIEGAFRGVEAGPRGVEAASRGVEAAASGVEAAARYFESPACGAALEAVQARLCRPSWRAHHTRVTTAASEVDEAPEKGSRVAKEEEGAGPGAVAKVRPDILKEENQKPRRDVMHDFEDGALLRPRHSVAKS